jgi:phosphoserine phosphatase
MARAVTIDDVVAEARALASERAPDDAPLTAAFDADGTLWGADVGEAAFARAAEQGMVHAETIRGPIAEFAARYQIAIGDVVDADGIARTLQKLADAIVDGTFERAGARRHQTQEQTLGDVFAMQAWCFAGCTLDELHAFGRRIFDEDIAPTVFAHTRILMHALRDEGFALAVVTASPDFLVRPAMAALGLADVRVLGMSTLLDGQRVIPVEDRVVYGAGKVRVLVEEFGAPPTLAFGDTVAGGDRDMLRSARLPVAVAPKGIHKEAADAWPDLFVLSTALASS